MVPEPIKHKAIRIIVIFLLIATALSFNLTASAAEPKKIALLPFKINAEKDMSFLQNGIFDMLTSRLSKEGEVVVIGRQAVETAIESIGGLSAVNESSARQIGSQLNADYSLFGSLTVLGDSISIDAKMVDITGKTPTTSFFEQSQDLGGVITKINQIAAQINTSVLDRQPKVAEQQTAPPPETPKKAPQKTAQKEPIDETHAHPEKLLKGHGAQGEGSPFIITAGEEEKGSFQRFWRSARFKLLFNGMALGDVDRDGKTETVVVTPDEVLVYRAESSKFYKAYEIKDNGSQYNIGVDVADINQNGFPEIFVTSLTATRIAIASSVFEYDGNTFHKIVDKSRWYYRVADVPGRGKILLGQKHHVAQPFSGRIYDMIWKNSEYVPEAEIKIPRPKSVQVMGLSLGDVINNKQETTVAYREDDRLQVIDANGDEMWKSSDKYGGSTLYCVGEKEDINEVVRPIYYPMRVVVADVNGDGESEVIVVNNHEIAGGHLDRFRKYTSAHVESMSWDGLGLAMRWKTRKITGYIRDYAVGDFDNDGKVELVAALILSEGSIAVVGEPKSTIIAYELPS